MVREPLRHAGFDFGQLLVRLAAGVALTWHGIAKFRSAGGWTNWMGSEDVFPAWAQGVAAVTETMAGLGLAVGFLTPLASIGVIAVMGGALHYHITQADPYVSATGGSWEYPAVLLAVGVLALFAGPGRLSVDRWLRRRRRARHEKRVGIIPDAVATTRRVRSGGGGTVPPDAGEADDPRREDAGESGSDPAP